MPDLTDDFNNNPDFLREVIAILVRQAGGSVFVSSEASNQLGPHELRFALIGSETSETIAGVGVVFVPLETGMMQ